MATGTCARIVSESSMSPMRRCGTWHAVMEDDSVPVRQTRMVYTVNSSAADVLATLSRQPRAARLDLEFSLAGTSPSDRKKGYFESRWGAPQSWMT